ncbi:MAG: type VI secretion system protein TssA, partial [Gemmatimonadetes bacterium]|nr:type VI secretion system protein TssA [Gemmatimonadota bacterium]
MTVATPTTPLPDPGRFLLPVTDGEPSGPSLRYEGTYDRVREARRSDDPSLPQGVWQRELKRADWPLAAELCARALETRSKDLNLGAWLLEAWLHLHGAAGLRAGTETLLLLCESFWDDVHPRIEDGSAEARAAPFFWINERLPAELRGLPVTRPADPDTRPYTWGEWQDLLRAEARAKKGNPEISPGRKEIEAGVAATDPGVYRAMAADLRAADQALAALQELLERRCGADAPTLSRIREGVDGVARWTAETYARVAPPEPEPTPEPETPTAEEAAMPPEAAEAPAASPAALRVRPFASREEAYRALTDAADYLMRTEPHSPVPYLVRRAVAWGGLSLADLIRVFLEEGQDLSSIRTLL